MPNESPSKNFERQIERIHRLLKAEGSEVTWNDRIPDPDNPSQARQIDITIRKGGQTTLVECRVHKSRQDVNWIQELIGRRESLRADAVIAVSASGFTAGAIAKAEKFGVILRDLWTLSQMEIASWGTPTKVNLVYYEFDECLVTFTMPAGAIPKRPAFTNGKGQTLQWRGLFEQLMKLADDKPELDYASGTMRAPIESTVLVDGTESVRSDFVGRVRRHKKEVSIVSVVAYAAPDLLQSPEAHVEKFDLEAFEILQSADDVAVQIDLSRVEIPPNWLLHGWDMDFGRVVTSKWFKIVGAETALRRNPRLAFRIKLSSK